MKEDEIINDYHWIDSLRVFATFCVIFLHVSAGILNKYGEISNFKWWIGNIYDSSVRFCVPIFLMISGVLILNKTYENNREYLKKRILRILTPFLFWSIIYISKDIVLKFIDGKSFSFISIITFIIEKFKKGASYHLWYIYLIIGLYLFFPIIAKWIRKSKKKEIEYFIGIWFITIIAQLPYINKIVPNINISYFSGYIGFPILGYYLSKYSFAYDKKKLLYILFILIGILITIFGTFFLTKREAGFNELFYGYLTPNVVLVSVGVFLLFKDFVHSSIKFNYVISFFNKYSYGTYLIHVLILFVLAKFNFSYAFGNPIIMIPITSILCFIISTLIIFIINKLPFGRYISG